MESVRIWVTSWSSGNAERRLAVSSWPSRREFISAAIASIFWVASNNFCINCWFCWVNSASCCLSKPISSTPRIESSWVLISADSTVGSLMGGSSDEGSCAKAETEEHKAKTVNDLSAIFTKLPLSQWSLFWFKLIHRNPVLKYQNNLALRWSKSSDSSTNKPGSVCSAIEIRSTKKQFFAIRPCRVSNRDLPSWTARSACTNCIGTLAHGLILGDTPVTKFVNVSNFKSPENFWRNAKYRNSTSSGTSCSFFSRGPARASSREKFQFYQIDNWHRFPPHLRSFIEIDSQHHSASKLLASQNRSVIRLTGLMPTHLLVVWAEAVSV